MMTRTDCDVRFATHARQIARVNAREWLRPQQTRSAQGSLRLRLGTVLIALGTRLASGVTQPSPDPLLASGKHA